MEREVWNVCGHLLPATQIMEINFTIEDGGLRRGLLSGKREGLIAFDIDNGDE